MSKAPEVGKCANPICGSEFKRLQDGKLAAFAVDDPVAWGLPATSKQKAVWLCDACASQYYVRLDRRHHAVQVVHRNLRREPRAA